MVCGPDDNEREKKFFPVFQRDMRAQVIYEWAKWRIIFTQQWHAAGMAWNIFQDGDMNKHLFFSYKIKYVHFVEIEW